MEHDAGAAGLGFEALVLRVLRTGVGAEAEAKIRDSELAHLCTFQFFLTFGNWQPLKGPFSPVSKPSFANK